MKITIEIKFVDLSKTKYLGLCEIDYPNRDIKGVIKIHKDLKLIDKMAVLFHEFAHFVWNLLFNCQEVSRYQEKFCEKIEQEVRGHIDTYIK